MHVGVHVKLTDENQSGSGDQTYMRFITQQTVSDLRVAKRANARYRLGDETKYTWEMMRNF